MSYSSGPIGCLIVCVAFGAGIASAAADRPRQANFPAQAASGATLPAGSQKSVAAQPPTARLTSQVTEVDVPVLVLDKQGQPIEQLAAEDFKLFDDNARQRITNFDSQARPLSLAIVVDIADVDAVAQVHRSAETIAAMVVGAAGEASVFVGGPEPKQILPFTADQTRLTDTLRRLALTGPNRSLAEPLNQALLLVQKQPRDHTRAVLIVSRSSPKSGTAAQSLVEATMTDAIPIFHLVPNRPKDLNTANPESTRNGGTGVGPQTGPPMEPPIDGRGQPEPTADSAGNINLGPVIGAVKDTAGSILHGHEMDYVYDSGGEVYSASNDNDFDQKLNLIGDELRSIYHLYYEPNNLASEPPLHQINVSVVERTDVNKLDYRRSYLGYKPAQ